MDRQNLDQLNNTLINPNGPEGKISAENHREYNNALADYAEDVAAERAQSAYLGAVGVAHQPPTVGAWWARAKEAGTYTNYSGTVVTAADLDVVNGVANNRVILEVNNGVATKRVERVKGDQGLAGKSTETWTAKAYAAGSPVYHNGIIWESNTATVAADIPGISEKWVKKAGARFLNELQYNWYPALTWTLDRSISTNGKALSTNIGWKVSNYIKVKEGNVIRGILRGDTSRNSVAFYKADTLISFVSVLQAAPAVLGNYTFEVTAPADGYILIANRYLDFDDSKFYLNILKDSTSREEAILRPKPSYLVGKSYLAPEKITLIWEEGIADITSGDFVNSNYKRSQLIPVNGAVKFTVSTLVGSLNGLFGFDDTDTRVWTQVSSDFGVEPDTQILDVSGFIPPYVTKLRLSTRKTALAELSLTKLSATEKEYTVAEILENNAKKTDLKTSATFIKTVKPKFAELRFEIALPTDGGVNRTPTFGSFEFINNGALLIKANCSLAIQGHGSTAYAKKGYTFDMFNLNNDGLKVKFGDMVESDSFHLKAYATDRTHSRDVANGRIWRDMVNRLDYPYNKVNNAAKVTTLSTTKNQIYTADAAYHTEGFPVAVYVNRAFHGLYTLRHKKTRENYALDNSNQNHIFLDSATYTAYLNDPFDPTDWEIKSPKMSGYIDAGAVVPNATVLAAAQRLFDWTRTITTSFATHADYINLPHWLCWIIFSEVISNRDTNGNNYNLITWDGVHWSIIPYDMDLTLGLNPWDGYIVQDSRKQMDISFDIWGKFKTAYATEIKALYTKLRKSGFLTTQNLYPYYINQVREIPRSVYEDDRLRFKSIWTNAEPSMEQIALFIENKLTYLDTVWLNP